MIVRIHSNALPLEMTLAPIFVIVCCLAESCEKQTLNFSLLINTRDTREEYGYSNFFRGSGKIEVIVDITVKSTFL